MFPNPELYFWDDWALLTVQALGVVLIAVYVWKTWQMASATREAAEASQAAVEEAKAARLEALAPRLLLYFDPKEVYIAYIVLENAGAGTAADVTMEFEPALKTPDREDNLKWFETPKAVVPPGTRLPHWFATWPAYLKSDLPRQYTVTVRYRGVENGQQYSVQHILDVDSLLHRSEAQRKGLHDLVGVVEKGGREIKREIERARKSAEAETLQRRYAGFRDRDLEYSLSALRSSWDVFGQAENEQGVFLDWENVVGYMRREAMTAYRAADVSGQTALSRALRDLTLRLWQRYRFGDAGWSDAVDDGFQRVEAVVAETSGGGGEEGSHSA